MVILIFPPFGIIEKINLTTGKNRVFATTTFGVMVKNQPVIHSSIWYVNEIGHRNHAQGTKSNRQAM